LENTKEALILTFKKQSALYLHTSFSW